MAPLKLLTVVSASLLVLNKTTGAVGTDPSYAVTLGEAGQCLSDINLARQAAGLSDLKTASSTTLPNAGQPTSVGTTQYQAWVWYPVCEALLTKSTTVSTPSPTDGGKFPEGTYAYYLANAKTVDCKTVLKQWKDAYKNFDGLPPVYSSAAEVYKNPDNVSLVAMYNPSTDAAADCRMVTCTKTPSGGSAENGYGLMCLTTPDALNKKAAKNPPFSQDQWDKIVSAIKNSASAVTPSVLGVAATILGFVMMVL